MCNARMWTRWALGVSLIGLVIGSAGWAQYPMGQYDETRDQDEQQTSQERMQNQQSQQSQQDQQNLKVKRTSKLIGQEAKGTDGEKLGTIHDLVLTPDFERVSYIALSSGGVWGIGDTLHAIPWSALKYTADDSCVLNLTKSQLEDKEGFNQDRWPSEADSQWSSLSGSQTQSQAWQRQQDTTTRAQQSQTARQRQQMESDTQERTSQRQDIARRDEDSRSYRQVATADRNVERRRVTKLTGMDVQNYEGENVGNVEEFVVAIEGTSRGMQQSSATQQSSGIQQSSQQQGQRTEEQQRQQGQTAREGAQGTRQQATGSQQQLTQQVEQKLQQQFPQANISVSINEDTATLRGSVQQENQKQQAEQIAKSVQGIENIENQINVSGGQQMAQQQQEYGRSYAAAGSMQGGHLVYTVISLGGFWGFGEEYALVPSNAVNLQSQRDYVRLDADKETLEAIAFNPDEWPNLSSRSYAQQVYSRFDEQPYWVILGFVVAEDQDTKSKEAWDAESEYNKKFDAEDVKTIEGTIESVGTFQPAAGVREGLRLRVKTDEDKIVTVYAGPQWYAQQEDCWLRAGDEVKVTGSEAEIRGRSVILSSKIESGDKTLELRGEDGKPKWKREGAESQQQDQNQDRNRSRTRNPGQNPNM